MPERSTDGNSLCFIQQRFYFFTADSERVELSIACLVYIIVCSMHACFYYLAYCTSLMYGIITINKFGSWSMFTKLWLQIYILSYHSILFQWTPFSFLASYASASHISILPCNVTHRSTKNASIGLNGSLIGTWSSVYVSVYIYIYIFPVDDICFNLQNLKQILQASISNNIHKSQTISDRIAPFGWSKMITKKISTTWIITHKKKYPYFKNV